jgi:exosortase/archaeosortase family protein
MTETPQGPRTMPAMWRLGAVFLGTLTALHLAYYADKQLGLGWVDRPYTETVAWVSSHVADWVLPYPVRVDGVSLVADERYTVVVASGCNGIEAVFLMIAGVLAYPATWRQRGRAFCWYLPALYLLNVARVVALTHIAHSYPQYMDVAHYQVAQGILILFVVAFWLHHLGRLEP